MHIAVPDLFEVTALAAEKMLKDEGLQSRLAGDLRQHATVRSQSPVAGTMVEKGSVVNLFLRVEGLPGPNTIDDMDGSETVHGTHEPD